MFLASLLLVPVVVAQLPPGPPPEPAHLLPPPAVVATPLEPEPPGAPLFIESEGAPLDLEASFSAVDGRAVMASCRTPCAIHVGPGPVEVRFRRPGGTERIEKLHVGSSGARVVLHPPPDLSHGEPPRSGGGGGPPAMDWLSYVGLTGIALGVAFLGSGAGVLSTGQTLYGDSRQNAYISIGVGAGLLVAGAVIVGVRVRHPRR
jgi:hypothetical protein